MKSPLRITIRPRPAAKSPPSRPSAGDVPRGAHRQLLLGHLDAWRNAADDVEAAARYWAKAYVGERRAASLVYFAALDREETAAAVYELALKTRRSFVT